MKIIKYNLFKKSTNNFCGIWKIIANVFAITNCKFRLLVIGDLVSMFCYYLNLIKKTFRLNTKFFHSSYLKYAIETLHQETKPIMIFNGPVMLEYENYSRYEFAHKFNSCFLLFFIRSINR
jgi:hypothetical protein